MTNSTDMDGPLQSAKVAVLANKIAESESKFVVRTAAVLKTQIIKQMPP